MFNAKYAVRISKNGERYDPVFAKREKEAMDTYHTIAAEASQNALDGGIDDWSIKLFKRKGRHQWQLMVTYIPEVAAHA